MYEEKLMTVPQVAEYFQLKEKTVYQLVASRKLPCFKVGGSIRFSMEQHIKPYLNRETKAPPSQRVVKYEPRETATKMFRHLKI